MTPQEAIKELKEYNSYQKKEKILSDRITEIIDTVISAYEVTDEEIAEKSRSLFPSTRDVIVNLIKISTREGYIMGATAFRDGKIKQP